MRVLLSAARRDERGAIAVLSAVLALVLIGVAAYAVDFGMAYNSKRQLQTAADSAALAAASEYATSPGKCSDLTGPAAPPTLEPKAEATAKSYLLKNRPGASMDNFTVGCDAKGHLTVDVKASGTTDVGLGKVMFSSNTLSTNRAAEATLDVPPSGNGLRPYMICSQFVPDAASPLPTGVMKVDFPTTSDTTGNCPHAAGNWFTLDCPHLGNSNNGNPDLATATATGCAPDHPISIVDPQDHTSPANLYNSLRAACPATANLMADYDADCLTSNPGNVSANPVITAWDSLVALHKPVLFPVFCGMPDCNPAGWVQGMSGNNTMYPVHKLAAAQVCGYHWGNKDSGLYASTGPTDLCNGADAGPGSNSDNYLLLAFTQLQVSGSTADSDCPIGDDSCDGGARRVLLTK